jgi:hypothetical protein
MSRPSAIAITRSANAGNLSPEHKRFRKLQDQIEQARARLLDWQQQAPLFAQAHAEKVLPLRRGHDQALREWAFEMEQLLLGRKWSRAEQDTLSRAIAELAAMLLDSDDDDTEADTFEALKALHDRHADVPFDQAEQQGLEGMKAVFETLGGMDLGDVPIDSMEELMQRAHEQMAQQREQASQQHQPAQAGPARKGRAKTKNAAQRRAEEDAAKVSQTVREVYRKLASALHPDRAPAGASAEQRAERTAQMAQANAAYAAGDLLALLNLQLAIEQVDAAHVANIAATQVRHFNKVLAEQLAELQAEIEGREGAFCAAYGVFDVRRPDPNQLGRVLKEAVRNVLGAQQRLQVEQRALRGDPAAAKAWVRRMRAEQQFEDTFGDMPF